MEELNDIANRARMLAIYTPDSAKCMLRELESLRACRQYPELAQFTNETKHAYDAFRANSDDAYRLMNDLVALVYKHLPELSPQFVRINPQWRFDDPNTDWPGIIKELLWIEEMALKKLLATSPGPSVVLDVATTSRDTWLIKQWEKGKTIQQILIALRKKPKWDPPSGESGVRSQLDAAYRRAGKTRPKRPQGRRPIRSK